MLESAIKIGKYILVSAIIIMTMGIPIILCAASWQIPYYGVASLLLPQIPSMLVTASAISIGTYILRGSFTHIIAGSVYGWLVGEIISAWIVWSFTRDIYGRYIPRPELVPIQIILCIIIGSILGLLPALVTWRQRRISKLNM